MLQKKQQAAAKKAQLALQKKKQAEAKRQLMLKKKQQAAARKAQLALQKKKQAEAKRQLMLKKKQQAAARKAQLAEKKQQAEAENITRLQTKKVSIGSSACVVYQVNTNPAFCLMQDASGSTFLNGSAMRFSRKFTLNGSVNLNGLTFPGILELVATDNIADTYKKLRNAFNKAEIKIDVKNTKVPSDNKELKRLENYYGRNIRWRE